MGSGGWALRPKWSGEDGGGGPVVGGGSGNLLSGFVRTY